MLTGPYRMAAYRMVGRIRLTNKTPCGTYRAPGRFESTFVRERLMDAIAAKLHIDPIESAAVISSPKSEMPYVLGFDTLGTEMTYDPAITPACSTKPWRRSAGTKLQDGVATTPRRRRNGGAGLAVLRREERARAVRRRARDGRHQRRRRSRHRRGFVGQGVETVVAQICADALGVDYRRINVVHGQTDRIAYGMGAFASRVTVMTGEATYRRHQIARHGARGRGRALAIARKPSISSTATWCARGCTSPPARAIGHARRNRARAGARRKTPRRRAARLVGRRLVRVAPHDLPYGVHLAVVRVDRGSGATVVERYVVAYDIGKAVNPMLVEGQIAGGVAQGIGGALFEEFLYDSHGEPLSVNFADYLMPTAREIPPIEVLDHRGRAEPAQSARAQRRRRRRRQSRRRRHCGGDR